MRNQHLIFLLLFTLSCKIQNKSQPIDNCFRISAYPEFKMGETVDTNRMPFNLMPFDTHDETWSEILSHSHAYMCLGFDGGMSTLIFSVENSDQKLNGIMASWTIMGDPENFMNRLKESYLPCIPTATLLRHLNTPIEDRSQGNPAFYQYSNGYSDGITGLHYWVGLKY